MNVCLFTKWIWMSKLDRWCFPGQHYICKWLPDLKTFACYCDFYCVKNFKTRLWEDIRIRLSPENYTIIDCWICHQQTAALNQSFREVRLIYNLGEIYKYSELPTVKKWKAENLKQKTDSKNGSKVEARYDCWIFWCSECRLCPLSAYHMVSVLCLNWIWCYLQWP